MNRTAFIVGSVFLAACSDPEGVSVTDTVVVADIGDTAGDTRDATTPPTDSAVASDTLADQEVGPPTIGWVILQYPSDQRAAPGEVFVVYGRVFVAGLTPLAGAATGLEAEAGVGEGEIAGEGWSWTAATFNVDVDGANDEYLASVTAPETEGTYRFAFRFRLAGGDWIHADLDGLDDGFDLADTGALVVVAPAPAAVDWCRLQHPPTITSTPGAPVGVVYGRVYEAGVSDTIGGVDPAYPIVGELGFGPEATAVADWTWGAAAWARDDGNDDEHEATFAAPALGSYRYAYRFKLDGDWTYCDLDGSDDGFDVADAGTLVVAEPPAAAIDYAIIRPSTLSWSADESPGAIEVVVFEAGVTAGAGQGAGIVVEVGYGAADAVTDGYTWQAAAYARDEDGLASLDNDVYRFVLPALEVGSWRAAARVTVGDGEAVLVDATGTADGFAVGDAATVAVSAATAPLPDWCRLLSAERITVAPGATVGPGAGLAVQIYEAGLTPNAGAGIVAEVGFGMTGSEPGASWTWAAAAFTEVDGNDDRHAGTLTAPATEGSWDVAARVRLSSEDTWRLCDRDGSDNGYSADQATRLDVVSPRVDFCRIQYPLDDVTVAAGAETPDLFVLVYEAGVTGESGSHAPALTTSVGYGAVGSTPGEAWTWSAGTFNGYLDNGFGQKTNDEHRGRINAPGAPGAGTWDWAWRVSLDAGATWVLCDEAGSSPYDPAQAGKLIVQ